MNTWQENLLAWLEDVYASTAVLLAVVALAFVLMRQPARRLVLAWAAVAGLFALAVLPLVPGWPRLACRTAQAAPSETVTLAFTELPGADPVVFRVDAHEAGGQLARGKLRVVTDPAGGGRPGPEGRGVWRAPDGPVAGAPADESAEFTPALARRPADPPARERWLRVGARAFSAGAALVSGWLAVGAVRTLRLRRRSREAPPPCRDALARIVGPARRPPLLRANGVLPQPVAVGAVRPAIILPAALAGEPPGPRLGAVLAHEWDHIRRGDLWLLAMTRALLVLLFAHPLYWWLRRRIRHDQELLADAAAARATGPVDYAAALLSLLHPGTRPTAFRSALAIRGRPSQMKWRIAMLLDPNYHVEADCTRRWRWGAGTLVALGAVVLSLFTLRPLTPAAADEPKAVPTIPKARDSKPAGEMQQMKKPVAAREAGIAPIRAGMEIKGEILSADGKPIAGAAVGVIAWAEGWSGGKPEVLGQAKTGNDGRFNVRIAKSPPWKQSSAAIVASATGHGPAWSTAVQSGISLHLSPEQTIPLRLIDLQGQPAVGVTVGFNRLGSLPPRNLQEAYLLEVVNDDPDGTPSVRTSPAGRMRLSTKDGATMAFDMQQTPLSPAAAVALPMRQPIGHSGRSPPPPTLRGACCSGASRKARASAWWSATTATRCRLWTSIRPRVGARAK